MATNKNAVLRYNTLDCCFRNLGRRYYWEDLLDAVNDALLEDDPKSSGVKTRQLRDDIRFMKSEAGYDAPIITLMEGKRGYYRYSDSKYSISKSPLNETEAEQLRNAVSILQRFEGSPQFEWVSEIAPLLKDRFRLREQESRIMGFETNIDTKGYEHITSLFNAIVNKRVLRIQFRSFKGDQYILTFHPYYLKQFNNRWFLFGRNEELNVDQWNVPLDRIESIEEIDIFYRKDRTNWEDYFFDIIGVTRPNNKVVQEVKLLFSPEQAPYITTKPLHPTQKEKFLESGELEVRIAVIPNYELEKLILSYADSVEVISPSEIRESIVRRLRCGSQRYE